MAQNATQTTTDLFGGSAVTLSELTEDREQHTWTATGEESHFLIQRSFAAGVVHLRLKMTSELARGRGSLCFDTGNGFVDSERILLPELRREIDIDTHLRLEKPVKAIRFEPIDKPGSFRIDLFSLEPVAKATLYLRAIKSKIREIKATKKTSRAIKKGISLLLKGDFKSFSGKLIQSLGGGVDTRAADYRIWRDNRRITEAQRDAMRKEIVAMNSPPLISILMPIYNPPEHYLRLAIESVQKQLYPHWELCLADDCSTKPYVRQMLDEFKAADSRIKVVYRERNGHISAATNSALAIATGPYSALLDNDDEISEHALFKVAKAILADPAIDMIYSDEDKIDLNGMHTDPFFKPDWSPEYFLSCMYTCHLGVYRTAILREIGGFRSEFDTAQDYDMVLRFTARTPRVHHIPEVLYHWRMLPTSTASGSAAKPKAHRVAQRALENWLKLVGKEGKVEPGPTHGFHRVRFDIIGQPKVSIVIPSACRRAKVRGEETWFLLKCVESIRAKTTYKNFEIVVVDNNDMSVELEKELQPHNIRKIPYTEAFNLASKMNLGAQRAEGSQLVFMNDDIEIITPEWIEAMLEFSQQPEIGAVGVRLFFPDGRLQHCGVNVLNGNPGHPFYGFEDSQSGYFFSTAVHRNYTAVTGACMMTRADVFWSVKGFSEIFPLNYNDVDFCLKVLQTGQRIVYTPYAEHYHHESVSKSGLHPEELTLFKDQWLKKWPRDPYYNPNLTTTECDYRIDTDYVA